MRVEARILREFAGKCVPGPNDFPRWPGLKLNIERILDGLRNGELHYGKGGVTRDDPALLDDPDLTIRHVDLKAWMSQFYPDQKPEFLFDDMERQLHPAISAETMQVLLADREALKLKIADMEQSLQILQDKHRLQSKQNKSQEAAERDISTRSEATYLSIVGGLLTLLLGQSPSGKRYSSFNTTDSIISTLLAYYPGRPGLSERTLWSKFKAAKQHINTDPY